MKPQKLRGLLEASVAQSEADGIQFSGGLDTSILATIAAQQGRRLQAVCVSVADGPGLDEPFAARMADQLGLELRVLRPALSDLIEKMPMLVGILGTFDPMELRNSIAGYFALEELKRIGSHDVLTGDGADELFAGYSYMFNMPPADLTRYIQHLNQVMHFSSREIASSLSIAVTLPYIQDSIRQCALELSATDLVCEREGKPMGKRILREAFADILPEEITWRVKTPIEFGSGSTALHQYAEKMIQDREYGLESRRAWESDRVAIRDKEHLLYYRMYRTINPPPGELPKGVKTCSRCFGPVGRIDMSFCRICGAYPI